MKRARGKNKSKGCWLVDNETLTVAWCGQAPAPHFPFAARIAIARGYILSKGHGPRFIDITRRLAKAVILVLNPSHTVVPPYDMVTTGLSSQADIVDEWTRFNDTSWQRPQTGQRRVDSFSERLSN